MVKLVLSKVTVRVQNRHVRVQRKIFNQTYPMSILVFYYVGPFRGEKRGSFRKITNHIGPFRPLLGGKNANFTRSIPQTDLGLLRFFEGIL